MTPRPWILVLALGSVLGLGSAAASEHDGVEGVGPEASECPVAQRGGAPPAAPVYVPPRRRAPAPRRLQAAGQRSSQSANTPPRTIAPLGLGLTTERAPRLYWHIDPVPAADVVFTLIREREDDPDVEVEVEVKYGGLQVVDLARLGVTLQHATEYEWSIAVVEDPARRSADLIANGFVMRTAGGTEGLWYDRVGTAMEALAEARCSVTPSRLEAHVRRAAREEDWRW